VVLTEGATTPARLADVLGKLLLDPEELKTMGAAASTMALPNAARRIAGRVLDVGGGS
jgi:UDP-N-acetylglucosamine:LPS N-acetylglucosamine transferase